MARYQRLAELLAERIEQGLYRHGEKLPSVRSLSQEHGVSISTVQQAYQTLETRQLITPQPRSGYFVAPRKVQPPVPHMSRPVQRPVEITQWDQVIDMLKRHRDKEITPFSSGAPDIEQPSLQPLWRELKRLVQHNLIWVELPEQVDMVCVAQQLCRLKIQVAPGSLFSASGKYRNCVRINCALPPNEKHHAVMEKLGNAIKVEME